MNPARNPSASQPFSSRTAFLAAGALCAALLAAPAARAVIIDTGNSGFSLRLDNTLKYSAAARIAGRDAKLISDINQDDGDRNFDRGLISSRLDLLSELDFSYGNFGGRVSAAGWYDQVYQDDTDHTAPARHNAVSVPGGQFTAATAKLMGKKAEVLDAFLFAKGEAGETSWVLRAGKQAQVWGESLFWGANGIAAGMAPQDIVKLVAVPGSQFKEIIRPVGQVVAQVQPGEQFTLAAFYQFEWLPSRLPPVGSYFSQIDTTDIGGERNLVTGGRRGTDLNGSDDGQYGFMVRFQPRKLQTTSFGLYYLNYHAKTFQVEIIVPPLVTPPAKFFTVYPENIKLYGASFSTVIGDANVAGEFSVRDNVDLPSDAGAQIITPANPVFDNDGNPRYAVGRTLHANLSIMKSFPRTALWHAATLVAEGAWNRLDRVDKNPLALTRDTPTSPTNIGDAWGVRLTFTPTYFQVLPGLELSTPVFVGYTTGKSALGSAGFGPDGGGNISLGLAGTYLNTWRFTANYVHYYGTAGTFLDATKPRQPYSFAQYYKDRDFVSFSFSRSF